MKTKRIKKELESDDELPPSYGEDFVLPAYENEHRFDPIVFRWINDTQKRANKLKEKDQGHVKSDSVHSTNMQKYKIKGYLSQQDLYCLKSVIGRINDTTFLWLVNFLMTKDMNLKYSCNFKSCLVEHYPCYDFQVRNNCNKGGTLKSKYKIVVKV